MGARLAHLARDAAEVPRRDPALTDAGTTVHGDDGLPRCSGADARLGRTVHGRRGRISADGRDRFVELYGAYGVASLDEANAWDARVLEVGFGAGESVVAAALEEPTVRVLAVEIFVPGILALLESIERHGLTNVRVARADVVDLLPRLRPGSFDLVTVLFPDPWPKRRHAGRRLVQPDFVRQAAALLCPGGVLHIATDWADYAEDVRALVAEEPALEPTSAPARSETRYERRAAVATRAVADLAWRRTGLVAQMPPPEPPDGAS